MEVTFGMHDRVEQNTRMSLRQADPAIKRLWEKLEDEQQAIVLERRRLQDIWRKISAMHRENAEARQA